MRVRTEEGSRLGLLAMHFLRKPQGCGLPLGVDLRQYIFGSKFSRESQYFWALDMVTLELWKVGGVGVTGIRNIYSSGSVGAKDPTMYPIWLSLALVPIPLAFLTPSGFPWLWSLFLWASNTALWKVGVEVWIGPQNVRQTAFPLVELQPIVVVRFRSMLVTALTRDTQYAMLTHYE